MGDRDQGSGIRGQGSGNREKEMGRILAEWRRDLTMRFNWLYPEGVELDSTLKKGTGSRLRFKQLAILRCGKGACPLFQHIDSSGPRATPKGLKSIARGRERSERTLGAGALSERLPRRGCIKTTARPDAMQPFQGWNRSVPPPTRGALALLATPGCRMQPLRGTTLQPTTHQRTTHLSPITNGPGG